MPNFFQTAETLAPKAALKKGAPKKATTPTEGLANYAVVVAIKEIADTLIKTLKVGITTQMNDHFQAFAVKNQAKPENYKGSEDADTFKCEASLQFKKRGSNSPLSDLEVSLLQEAKLPFSSETDTVETYVINPAYKDDEKLLAKVSKALSGIKDIPEDFIQKQVGTTKHVVTDETVTEFCKLAGGPLRALLPVVITNAVGKPKMTSKDPNKPINFGDLLFMLKDIVEENSEALEDGSDDED